MTPSLVVFDLGGTTIRDRGEVVAAFTTALEKAGIAFEPAEVERWRGASKRDVLQRLAARQGLPTTAAAVAYDTFSAALKARFAAAPDLAFAGSAATFARLKAAGIRLALNSGFDRDIVNLVLGSTGWAPGTFDAIVCAEDVLNGRPAPDMILRAMEITAVGNATEVAVIGDTRLDLEAGARAGAAWRIGVLTGAHNRAALEAAPHTHVVADISAAADVVLS
ncbi:MAG: HAD family hydrolase [Gemmatimonadetes bacterium]|nr:HAD family hydrolase [Gemmatimonadota bacterium]